MVVSAAYWVDDYVAHTKFVGTRVVVCGVEVGLAGHEADHGAQLLGGAGAEGLGDVQGALGGVNRAIRH